MLPLLPQWFSFAPPPSGTPNQPPLEGLYQAGMPLLQQSLFQFHELLKEEHPRLGNHLEQEGVVPSMYCTHWFNTLFAYSLPFEQLLRVWDVFLLEGMKVRFACCYWCYWCYWRVKWG
jgi:hypothetical protein